MGEQVFFEERGVKVTNARFIVDAHTYAMNGVTSVKSTIVPPDRGKFVVGILIGLAILFAASGAGRLLGLAVAGFCAWLLMQQKDTHAVMLSSASGEQQALSGTDADFIRGVIYALNEALIHRG
jgi:hypothetical protein